MIPRFTCCLLFALAAMPALYAQVRPWKSADGLRTVQGEFVKRDATSVTIRNGGGKEVVIDFSKLHPDERKWLDQNHAIAAKPPAEVPATDPSGVFDTLTFEDTRETAETKLKASKVVVMTMDETFIGRSGLNGAFRTRQKIGGLSVFLFFDWTDGGKLQEITLQTETRPDTAYKTELEPCWKGLVELLTELEGKPVQKGPFPSLESLSDGAFSPSHLWSLDVGGSALLGTARDGKKYQLVVRLTQKKIQPIASP